MTAALSARILLAFDDEADEALMRHVLTKYNFANELESARGFLKVRTLFAGSGGGDRPRPELILLALSGPLPGLLDLARKSRENPVLAAVPLIVLIDAQDEAAVKDLVIP